MKCPNCGSTMVPRVIGEPIDNYNLDKNRDSEFDYLMLAKDRTKRSFFGCRKCSWVEEDMSELRQHLYGGKGKR